MVLHIGMKPFVVQFLDDGWKICQWLICLYMVMKSVTGEKLAREFILVIYSTNTQQLLLPKDHALLKLPYLDLLSADDFSHTIDQVREYC